MLNLDIVHLYSLPSSFLLFSISMTGGFPISLLFSCYVMSDSFVIPWTAAHQAPLSMGFPRQEYWSGLSFPSPGDHPNPGNEQASLALQGDSLPLERLGVFPKNQPLTLWVFSLAHLFSSSLLPALTFIISSLISHLYLISYSFLVSLFFFFFFWGIIDM